MPVVSPNQLVAHWKKGLSPLYTLVAEEPVQAIEVQDALRQEALHQGYKERKIFICGSVNRFDWQQIDALGNSGSLFGDKTMFELQLTSGTPGKEGAKILEKYIKKSNPDVLGLVILPKLDYKALKTDWFSMLSEHSILIKTELVDRHHLPQWLRRRLLRQEQTITDEALEFLSAKVDGNLLAAHQEVQKIALLCPPGEVSLADLENIVSYVAKYTVSQLSEAWLVGDYPLFARMLQTLREEKEELVVVLGYMSNDIRALARLFRKEKVWKGKQTSLYAEKIRHIRPQQVSAALHHAAYIDRAIKGFTAPHLCQDLWQEIYHLGWMLR